MDEIEDAIQHFKSAQPKNDGDLLENSRDRVFLELWYEKLKKHKLT